MYSPKAISSSKSLHIVHPHLLQSPRQPCLHNVPIITICLHSSRSSLRLFTITLNSQPPRSCRVLLLVITVCFIIIQSSPSSSSQPLTCASQVSKLQPFTSVEQSKMTLRFTNPYLTRRTTQRKAPPTISVDLASTLTAPTSMSSPPARPVSESMLDSVPERSLSSEAGREQPLDRQSTSNSLLLTCPHCFHVPNSHASSSDSPPACPRCLRHSKAHERSSHRNDAELTSFPSLLQEHVDVQEWGDVRHEHEAEAYGSCGSATTAVFRGRRGSDAREKDASQRSLESWSGWRGLWSS
jgi:hypothetical protein